ncbi:MAG: uroporphyrinogen-III synthase [candidate division KSB1 bacterium]|nr:uroporphyrinogen-III synthase [candidate division KSB1 bacterium]
MQSSNSLKGKTILVTRAEAQAKELQTLIEARGGRAVLLPCIQFRAYTEGKALLHFKANLHFTDWLILTSANGARFCRQFLDASGAKLPKSLRVAVIGQKTRKVAEEVGIRVDFSAEALDSRDFVRTFLLRQTLPYRVFYPTSRQAHDVLEKEFNKFGVDVIRQDIYETVPVVTEAAIREAFRQPIDALTFFSPSAAQAFMMQCPYEVKMQVKELPTLSIGSTTSAALAEAGMKRIFTAVRPSMNSMLTLLQDIFAEADRPLTGD